jgi:hypothetical protein
VTREQTRRNELALCCILKLGLNKTLPYRACYLWNYLEMEEKDSGHLSPALISSCTLENFPLFLKRQGLYPDWLLCSYRAIYLMWWEGRGEKGG